MNSFPIATAADVAGISRHPYASFMAHASVYQALQATADRYPDSLAMSFIEPADLAVPARIWTYAEFLSGVRRAANLFRLLAGGGEPRRAVRAHGWRSTGLRAAHGQ